MKSDVKVEFLSANVAYVFLPYNGHSCGRDVTSSLRHLFLIYEGSIHAVRSLDVLELRVLPSQQPLQIPNVYCHLVKRKGVFTHTHHSFI